MPLPRAFNKGTRLATVGLELGLAVAIGAILGYWLDQTFETTRPWLSIAGLLLGVLAGGQLLFRAVRHSMKDQEQEESRREDALKGGSSSRVPVCQCRPAADNKGVGDDATPASTSPAGKPADLMAEDDGRE